MKTNIALTVALALGLSVSTTAQDKPSVKPLTNSTMTGIAGYQYMMAEVFIPAHTTMPRHTHPTEEFLYILEGQAILRIEGRQDQMLVAGTSAVIPAGAVHTAVTTDLFARALTNRVHPDGVPVMTPAPEQN